MDELNDKAIAKLINVGEMIGQPVLVPGGNTPFAVVPNDAPRSSTLRSMSTMTALSARRASRAQ